VTHYQQLYDRDYLGSWDLPEGHDLVATISIVKGGELTSVGGRKNKKPIISIDGQEKKFVCNKTNAKTIAAMYGNHIEKWSGKKIALYISTTRDPSTGGDIACIRVRPQTPSGEATVTNAQKIEAALKEYGVDKAKLIAKINGGEIDDLDDDDTAKAIAWIQKQRKAA
jgi:hypothetical protein